MSEKAEKAFIKRIYEIARGEIRRAKPLFSSTTMGNPSTKWRPSDYWEILFLSLFSTARCEKLTFRYDYPKIGSRQQQDYQYLALLCAELSWAGFNKLPKEVMHSCVCMFFVSYSWSFVQLTPPSDIFHFSPLWSASRITFCLVSLR